MTNPNDSINPILNEERTSVHAGFPDTLLQTSSFGLTKREYFAAMAMQGLIANCFHGTGISDEEHAIKAASMADYLINALN